MAGCSRKCLPTLPPHFTPDLSSNAGLWRDPAAATTARALTAIVTVADDPCVVLLLPAASHSLPPVSCAHADSQIFLEHSSLNIKDEVSWESGKAFKL